MNWKIGTEATKTLIYTVLTLSIIYTADKVWGITDKIKAKIG